MTITPKSMPLKSTALQRGLSLVELVAVLAIIGVLTSISVPMYSDYITRSKVLAAYEILTNKQKELVNYLSDNGTILNVSACGNYIDVSTPHSSISTADWNIACQPKSSTAWVLEAKGASPVLKDSSGANAVWIAFVRDYRAFNGYSIGWMGSASTGTGVNATTNTVACWPTNKNQTTCTGS